MMIKLGTLLVSALLLAAPASSGKRSASSSGPVRVKGSVNKRTGAVTPPHVRTRGNRTETDNWSSKGNVNPTTGKRGSRTPKK